MFLGPSALLSNDKFPFLALTNVTSVGEVIGLVADGIEVGLIVNVLCDEVGVQIVTLIGATFPI